MQRAIKSDCSNTGDDQIMGIHATPYSRDIEIIKKASAAHQRKPSQDSNDGKLLAFGGFHHNVCHALYKI